MQAPDLPTWAYRQRALFRAGNMPCMARLFCGEEIGEGIKETEHDLKYRGRNVFLGNATLTLREQHGARHADVLNSSMLPIRLQFRSQSVLCFRTKTV
jgi:hypothetical protein